MSDDDNGEDKTSELKYEATVSLDEALSHISNILHGLAHQRLTVASDEAAVQLTPASVVQLEVEARDKDGRQKLEIELSWTKVDSGKSLRIVVDDEDEPCAAADTEPAPASDEGAAEDTGDAS